MHTRARAFRRYIIMCCVTCACMTWRVRNARKLKIHVSSIARARCTRVFVVHSTTLLPGDFCFRNHYARTVILTRRKHRRQIIGSTTHGSCAVTWDHIVLKSRSIFFFFFFKYAIELSAAGLYLVFEALIYYVIFQINSPPTDQ